MRKDVYVTQPDLPPIEEFTDSLKVIWNNKHITNFGVFHREFEDQLARYLGVKYVSLFASGTLALMTALKSLNITGEVITTPYSFCSTSHSILWNSLEPVFVDIEADGYTLDPAKVEEAITSRTSAILPVHVYGNACKMKQLQDISEKYNLKIIYDAAHAFGVKKAGVSILSTPNISILSFHATKVFNTIEGGAVICSSAQEKQRVDYLKNFGFIDETEIVEPGINAKMNELQAAYGLLQLKYVDSYILKRTKIALLYKERLNNIDGIKTLTIPDDVQHNWAYFPIFVDAEKFGMSRDELYELLKSRGIYGRRYFYPLISKLHPYNNFRSAHIDNLPISEKVSGQVICLPIYPELDFECVEEICSCIVDYSIKACINH